jgi:hypothetical protein
VPGHAGPPHCENCHVALQGEFCHHCGQSIHNPVRHAGHALEEFFESFWHLDGRVFRTLRDTLVPGRTAIEYLAGHRQRYLPPLRLFVVMSLLAFFIGQLTIHLDREPITLRTDTRAILESRTVEEVERNRDEMLARIEQSRVKTGKVLPVDAALIAAQVQIQGEAANRIKELGGSKPSVADAGDPQAAPTVPPPAASGQSGGALFSADNAAWDPVRNPVDIRWLPDFANRWLTARVVQGRDNIERMDGRPDLMFKAFMSSLPSALFLLVPVFAVMLKLAYVFKRRLYLEHLVVALYSHVFLLMALTTLFLSFFLAGWLQAHANWLSVCVYVASAALITWIPLYLLFTQKRVYGQGWPMTLVKYTAIGIAYVYLLALAVALMLLVTLVKA